MRIVLLSLLIGGLAANASAQPGEDAAHHADRARTRQLNRAAAGSSAPRPVLADRSNVTAAQAAQAQEDYRRAQDDYANDLAAWRRRVQACQAGDWDACQRR